MILFYITILHKYAAVLVLWWKYIIMFCIIIENKISSHHMADHIRNKIVYKSVIYLVP